MESEKGMTPQELQAKVDAIPYWYHRIDLPGGVKTYGDSCKSEVGGFAPMSAEAYRVPEDLGGLRVLDVGAWDGYWTFEALRRGARQVVAIDDFSDVQNFLDPAKHPKWETFDLCRDAFGYTEPQCIRREQNVYTISELDYGTFDVVFFFGVLYHCRHPMLALDTLSRVCTGEIYIESAICDDYSPYYGMLGRGYAGKQYIMEFYPDDQYGMNPTNWWAPTLHCLNQMVRAAGWTRRRGWKLCEPTSIQECRGFVWGTKNEKGTDDDRARGPQTPAAATAAETIE